MYTKKEIADGIVKFIGNDLLNDIDNKHMKFSLTMAKKALHENPDLLDVFFDSPIISSIITVEDDSYDIESFIRTLKNVLSTYESYTITIPKIPMFAPKEGTLKITAMDIDKIVSYLAPQNTVQ